MKVWLRKEADIQVEVKDKVGDWIIEKKTNELNNFSYVFYLKFVTVDLDQTCCRETDRVTLFIMSKFTHLWV